jgi:hypothetical protein
VPAGLDDGTGGLALAVERPVPSGIGIGRIQDWLLEKSPFQSTASPQGFIVDYQPESISAASNGAVL